MPTYRIYTLTNDDRVAAPARPVDCADDAAAIRNARQWLDGHMIEVWDGDRLVGRLDPDTNKQ